MSPKAIKLRVRGRVQGVFFRKSALAQAQRLGLTGWVRNLPDGQVEALAEGPSDAVDAFVAWCRHGPPAARVDAVEEEPLSPSGGRPDFFIQR